MKKRNFLSCLLIIAIVLATISPTVLFAAEDIAQDEQVYDETYTEETEEYVEETPEAYDWTIETNELKKWPQGPRVEAEGATVMDLDTGAFLYSKNAEAKLYPASITKIMTMLVALEHISDSDLDTKVKASESALAPIDSDSSQIWLSVGEKITVRSALYAIMLASANDAANVIAEYVGGSMDNFVKMMNDKAKELGCVNTHFVNPHGLHNKKHYTCAHDMALIAQHLRQDFTNLPAKALVSHLVLELIQHFPVKLLGSRVNREHTGGFAYAQSLLSGQLPVNITCQRGHEIDFRHMLLAVQNCLIQVGDAPSLGNVILEQFGQFPGSLAGNGISPGTEGYQLLPILIKYQIAVHHGADSDGTHLGKLCAVFFLHVLFQGSKAALQSLPDQIQRIGPDTVAKLILPIEISHCDSLVAFIYQYRLDTGRTQFNTKGCFSI